MIAIIRPTPDPHLPGNWSAHCRICQWQKFGYRAEHRARHAAAQHLWAKRGRGHRKVVKIHRPNDTPSGNTTKELCPTPTKKRHGNREEAVRHIASLYASGLGNPDYNPYRCICGCWHVGHSRDRLRRRVQKTLKAARR